MSNARDILYLTLIGEAIADIRRRFANMDHVLFLSDRDEQALAAFRLSIIGENANKLSTELKARYAEIPWADMVAFRNIVSHEYHRIDPDLVWEVLLDLCEIAAMVEIELTENRGNQ
jgi:uncharacterized protein with HEPN domain